MNRIARLLCLTVAGAGLIVAGRPGAAMTLSSQNETALESSPAVSPIANSSYDSKDPQPETDASTSEDSATVGALPDDSDAPEWTWFAGVEATYLKPHAHDLENPVPGSLYAQDFVGLDKFDAAPRLWLGVENCDGRGVRARYWQYQDANSSDSLALDLLTGNGVSTTAYDRMDAYAIDLELTARKEVGCWDMLGSFGVRNGSLSRDVSFAQFDSASDVFASTHEGVQFNGTGLTGALEGRCPFGCHDLSLVANLRGSALWGTVKQLGTSTLSTPNVTDFESVDTETNKTLWIFEAQAGLQWTHDLTCCRGQVFAQALFEYQYWNVNDTPFVTLQQNSGASVVGASLSSRVDFYGPTFAVGFTR